MEEIAKIKAMLEQRSEIYYVNPGSVSIPKQGSAHGYMVLEGDRVTYKDLSGAALGDFTFAE